MITIDGTPIVELMEVALNRILTAENEVRYIIQYVRDQDYAKPHTLKAINEEFRTIRNANARLLGYLSLIDPKHNK